MVYDELILTHDAGETKGMMGTDPITNLSATPMSCGLVECHSSDIDNNNYVFNPTDE